MKSSSFENDQTVLLISSGELCKIKRIHGSVLTLSCIKRAKIKGVHGFNYPSIVVHDAKVVLPDSNADKVLVRRLTQDEISRFNSAEENEGRIKASYGEYGEFDSIREGQWIMGVGIFSDTVSM